MLVVISSTVCSCQKHLGLMAYEREELATILHSPINLGVKFSVEMINVGHFHCLDRVETT